MKIIDSESNLHYQETEAGDLYWIPGTGLQLFPKKKVTRDPSHRALFENYIKRFNEASKRNCRGDAKTEKAFGARIKEGFTVDEMINAYMLSIKEEVHVKNHGVYVTPEFCTRAEVLNRYAGRKVEQKQIMPTYNEYRR